MIKVIEAIYEGGALRPLEDPGLQNGQRVRVKIEEIPEHEVRSTLEEWHKVYEGLSEVEIDEIDAIIKGR